MDNSINLHESWAKVLKKLETDLGHEADLWIKPINPLSIDGDTLNLEVPDQLIYSKVRDKYETRIIETLKELTGQDLKLHYSLSLAAPTPRPAPVQQMAAPSSTAPVFPADAPAYSRFNPNYTFDSFVVGTSNRFAFVSAESVAKNPGQSNLFFIYSAPGLGKTHLLHAIANEILSKKAGARMLLATGENFVNDYIESVRTKETESFRGKYRNLDCLFIDDIQFLVDKERSEEEFFYTFNSLFESKKQIVVTSDRPPKELSLNQRLISRFLSGVVADVKTPDVETRIAILRQKNAHHNFAIPDDVLTFMAENVKKNIRELEGCLITVGNYCSNMKIQPTIDVTREIIKNHISASDADENNKITVDIIKGVVAEQFHLDPKDFKSPKKTENIAYPRQIAMYLACQLTDLSLPAVGDAFNKDHSTVIYARDKIKQLADTEWHINELLNKLISKIKTVSSSARPS